VRNRLTSLTALLASNCTLRCAYCYQQPGGSLVMTWPTLRAALDVLLSSSAPSLTVEFSGGEPLLAFPLIPKAVRHVEVNAGGRPIRFELTTNGTLLDRARLDFLDAHGFVVKLSYHPVPGARDRRSQAVFRRLDRLLDRLRRRDRLWRERLQVAVTVGRRELPRLADTVRYLMQKRVRHIGLAAAFEASAWHTPDTVRMDRQFERITRLVLEHRERTGDVPVALFRSAPAGVSSGNGGRRERPRVVPDLRCSGARGTAIAVDPTGRAWGCVMLAGTRPVPPTTARSSRFSMARSSPLWRFLIGDVRDEDFPRRLRSYASRVAAAGVFSDRVAQHSSDARCGSCRWLDGCAVCPASVAFGPAGGDERQVSDFVCAFTRVSHAHAGRLPPGPGLAERLTGRAPVPTLVRELRRAAQRARGGSIRLIPSAHHRA